MSTTYLLIANKNTARIWRSKSDCVSFREIARVDSPRKVHETCSMDQDIYFAVPLFRRSEDGSIPFEELDREFARSLAQRLTKEFEDGTFDELILVADSRFLGLLREKFGPSLRKIVKETIREDLGDQTEFQIKRSLRRHFTNHSPASESIALR